MTTPAGDPAAEPRFATTHRRLLQLCAEAKSDAGDVLADTVDAVLDYLYEAELDGAESVSIRSLRTLVEGKLGDPRGGDREIVEAQVVRRARELE